MEAREHIVEKLDAILDCCEKHLATLYKFKRENYSIHDFAIKLVLSKDRIIIINIGGLKKIQKKGIGIRTEKGEMIDEEVKTLLSHEISQLYLGTVVKPIKHQDISYTQAWYVEFESIASEPYIDLSNFKEALEKEFEAIKGQALTIPNDKKNDFIYLSAIYKKLYSIQK